MRHVFWIERSIKTILLQRRLGVNSAWQHQTGGSIGDYEVALYPLFDNPHDNKKYASGKTAPYLLDYAQRSASSHGQRSAAHAHELCVVSGPIGTAGTATPKPRRTMIAKVRKKPPRNVQRGQYWISRADQLKVLQSAVRMDIVDRLVAVGPMSVKDLAVWTGKKTTPIYHHLRQMEKVGLVHRTHEFGTRGRPAAVYEASGTRMRLALAPLKGSNRKPMARIGRIVASQAAKDYAAGFHASDWQIQGPKRNHWMFRCVARPSPQRLKKINALLDELGELIWTPDPSPGELSVSIAWFLSPLQTHSSKRR